MMKKIILLLITPCVYQTSIVFGINLKKQDYKPKLIIFHFNLAESAMTSAGVDTASGVLIKNPVERYQI